MKVSKENKTPLYSSCVKAGFPSPAENDIEKNLDLNSFLVKHPSSTFFVRVDGNSMNEANIFDKDILIVDRSISPEDRKIVIAVINGEFTVKRIRIINKKIYLEAENKDYKTIEIDPSWDFQIWGVVTYIIHKAV